MLCESLSFYRRPNDITAHYLFTYEFINYIYHLQFFQENSDILFMNEGEELGDSFDNNHPQESAEVCFNFIVIVIIIILCSIKY